MIYNLNSVDKILMKLYNLLQTVEADIKKAHVMPTNQVIAIQSGGGHKRKLSNTMSKGNAVAWHSKNGNKAKRDRTYPPLRDPKEALCFTLS